MQVHIRMNGALATQAGRGRLTLELPAEATVADVIERLVQEMPDARPLIERAVAVIAGAHAPAAQPVGAGQEVALLLPMAGG